MNLMRLLFYVLWLAQAVLQGIVATVMVRRKLHHEFPIFFAYIGYQVCSVLGMCAARLLLVPGRLWGPAFFVDSGVVTVLRFAVIYEVFDHLFRNYSALNRLGKPVFRGVLLAFLIMAMVLAAVTHGNEAYLSLFVLHLLQQTASILQIGLLMFLFIFSTYLGLAWANYVFGLALGLGVWASTTLAASVALSQLGISSHYVNYITMGAYNICVLVWIFYLLIPEQHAYRAVAKLPDDDLEVWNRELRRLF